VDYYIEEIIGSRKTFEENLDSTEAAISFISNIGDVIQRNLFIKRVSEKLNIDQEILKRETNRKPKPRTALKEVVSGKRKPEEVDALELSFIHMMLEYPHKIPEIANGGILDYFTSEDLKRLGKMLKQSYNKNGDISASDIVGGIEDGAVKKRLLGLIMSESPYDVTVVDKIFADLAKRIKRKWYKKKHLRLKRELIKAQEMDDQKSCSMLLVEKQRLLTEERETMA
jgi:DNA primase